MTDDAKKILRLQKIAEEIRRDILKMLFQAGSGHTASPLGLADLYAAAYFEFLRHNPQNPDWPERDLFIVSNGHTAPVQYAALARAGYFPLEELESLRQIGSRLQGHPERYALPGVETTSGPLGSGLSQAAGMAYSYLFLDSKFDQKIYVIVGDGEINEGNFWEGAMFAAHHKLDNLILFIDENKIQIDGTTDEVMNLGSISGKMKSFGWQTQEIDGNNISEILSAVDLAKNQTGPSAIILKTIPGKGVDFMENDFSWHGKVPDKEQLEAALSQIDFRLEKLNQKGEA